MRKPSPATAISLVALFFSLTGAGFAASRYLITSKSQIKPSVLRALQGDQGPRGPAGANGLQGPQGTQGPIGSTGSQGPVADPSKLIFVETPPVTLSSTGLIATSAHADCPPDYFPLNGGFITSNTDVAVIADWQPPETNVWDVDARIAPGGSSGTLRAWANCAPN